VKGFRVQSQGFGVLGEWFHARPFVGVFQKSILDRFVKFWRLFPAKWLQNRPQIPKPSPEITPRRAVCGDPFHADDTVHLFIDQLPQLTQDLLHLIISPHHHKGIL